MKKSFLIIASAIFLIITGCVKSSPLNLNNTLVGKWILTEYLADPGDGSGKWQPADPNNPSFLELTSDGRAVSNGGTFGVYDRYQVLNDSTLQFNSSSSSDQVNMRYKFAPGSLDIYPPCIEKCGFKYKSAKK